MSATSGHDATLSSPSSAVPRRGGSSGGSHTARDDPWPQMERQVDEMVREMTQHIQRFRDTAAPTVTHESSLLEAVASCSEAVEDMRFALDTAMEHPESFTITTDELQRRAERIRAYEREVLRAQQLAAQVRSTQQRRAEAQARGEGAGAVASDENNAFLQQEHEAQRTIVQVDDQTLDRLSSGIHRVKDTATNIRDELTTQEHILDDIDRGMTRLQIRIDGAMKKVGHLLDSTSDRGKLICIAVLFVILILLVVFLLR